MGDVGEHFSGAGFEECVGCVNQRATGIDDVVDQDAAHAGHVADHVHDLALAGPLAPLVANGDGAIDALSQRTGAHHAADVRRDDNQFGSVEAFLNVAGERRRGKQIVGRDIEEALDLAGVQIECHDAVDAGALDHVGDQLGGNRCAGTRLAILPRIAEIGHHGGDALGR